MKEQNGSTSGRPMRRKERELTVDQAWEVVERTDHAVLATVDDEGNPYGVPITPVAADRKRIYFHATGKPSGRKSDNMKMNRRVSLTYIGKELTVPELYTVDYASAIVEGTASIVTDPAERAEAMVAMVRRHAPGNSDARNAIQFTNRLGALAVWRIDVVSISGKARAAAKWETGKTLQEPTPMPVQPWLVGAPK